MPPSRILRNVEFKAEDHADKRVVKRNEKLTVIARNHYKSPFVLISPIEMFCEKQVLLEFNGM